jgi:hypothetical protein
MQIQKFARTARLSSIACLVVVITSTTSRRSEAQAADSKVWQFDGLASIYRISDERTEGDVTLTTTRYLWHWNHEAIYTQLPMSRVERHFNNAPRKPAATTRPGK